MLKYHDAEWGLPVDDDQLVFEKFCLEGFQSGLSWRTILNKREAFREVFESFNFEKVARYGVEDVQRLMDDDRIVRHRGKIEATINNAQRACELVESHGSLGAFVWRYEPEAVSQRPTKSGQEFMNISRTPDSVKLAKDLKAIGWRFFGPTTAYAFMQAMGLVNDHVPGCVKRDDCEFARRGFVRPAVSF